MTWQFQTLANTTVDAPLKSQCGCGRNVASSMLYQVTGYTPEERSAKGWAPETEYVCDSCLSMGIRTGSVNLSELAESQGAPTETVTALQAREG